MAEIVIYTRQLCGFCSRAKQLLKQKGAAFTEHDATMKPDVKAEMIAKSGGARTFPQIFINGQHVGGCDDLMALERSGKLDPMLVA